MTREERQKAIADLETLLAYIPIYRRFYQSISMGIKALEQEPKTDVLDKIRAEIEKVFCMSVVTNELRTPMEVKTEILQIIDKYKAESEEINMYKPLNMFTKQTDELKQLISEHPDYPIVVLCNYEVCGDDSYNWWYAPTIGFEIGEILDCEQDINDERVYTDRDEFEDDLADKLGDSGDYDETTDEEFDTIVKAELAKYEPYWKKVIQIRADV